ncbi:MAG: HigA family addiction module antitoxin [Terracidiphilus sp.]
MNKIPFAYSIHPGEILKTEFMEPLGLSSYQLARDLHVSAPRVNDIVLGKRSISADTALRLSIYFGNSADFWLGLQMDHDLWVAAKNELPDPPYAKVMPRAQAA